MSLLIPNRIEPKHPNKTYPAWPGHCQAFQILPMWLCSSAYLPCNSAMLTLPAHKSACFPIYSLHAGIYLPGMPLPLAGCNTSIYSSVKPLRQSWGIAFTSQLSLVCPSQMPQSTMCCDLPQCAVFTCRPLALKGRLSFFAWPDQYTTIVKNTWTSQWINPKRMVQAEQGRRRRGLGHFSLWALLDSSSKHELKTIFDYGVMSSETQYSFSPLPTSHQPSPSPTSRAICEVGQDEILACEDKGRDPYWIGCFLNF